MVFSKLNVNDGFAIHIGRDKKGYYADAGGKIVAQDESLRIFGDRLSAWVLEESRRVPAPIKKGRK